MKRLLPNWLAVGVALSALLIVGILLWHKNRGVDVRSDDQSPGTVEGVEQGALSDNADAKAGAEEQLEVTRPNGEPERESATTLSNAQSDDQFQERRRELNQRRALLAELRRQPATDLASRLRLLLDAAGQDPRLLEERKALVAALTESLQTSDQSSHLVVYAQIAKWLNDESVSLAAKLEIARLLGAVQTPQSVGLLLNEYGLTSNDKLRDALRAEIAKTGDVRWQAQFHEELSPVLEAAWKGSKDDLMLARAIADGLAKVGAPEGINLLIAEIVQSAKSLEGLSGVEDSGSLAAFDALTKARNPNALPVLASGLLGDNSSQLQKYLCGISLAGMGSVEATRTLMRWAATASDQEAEWAAHWFGQLRDTASFSFVEASVGTINPVTFSSEAVRNAVALGLKNR